MEVIRGRINIKPRHQGAVVTIGNYDGVHRGHQAILQAVTTKAARMGVPSMLICFEPQPREFFDEYNAPARLTRFREKVDLLSEQGLDYVYCVKFDDQSRNMSAEEFVRVLVEDLRLSALYVGDDFRFGNDRRGDFAHLKAAGERNSFEVVDINTIAFDNERVSSTRIRECLADGNFELAESLLGHPYSISGKVIYGRQIGRTLGVPTANIQLHRYVAPISGVFAVQMALENDEVLFGVANVGVRPTFEDKTLKPILEVHLFDFHRDIYGSRARVIFRHKIRDEKKFADVEELKAAIMDDMEKARTYFSVA